VAIQNAAGTSGVTFSHNEDLLEPGDRVSFFPRDNGRTQYLAYGADESFQDIRGVGRVSTAVGDDAVQEVPIGFTFNYFGREIDELTLTSNGQLNLDGDADYSNANPLPDTREPSGLIGVFWDDLDNSAAGTRQILYHTLGAAGSRTFIVQWHRVRFLSYGDSDLTFQVLLHEEDSSIEYAFGGLLPGRADDARRDRASGSGSTLGAQNWERDVGLTISHNTAGVALSGSRFVLRPEE
jgi:hypothetical protein